MLKDRFPNALVLRGHSFPIVGGAEGGLLLGRFKLARFGFGRKLGKERVLVPDGILGEIGIVPLVLHLNESYVIKVGFAQRNMNGSTPRKERCCG